MPNLTIKQAALFTGRDEKTVRRWILGSAGKPPRIPTHARDTKGRYLVAQSELERILAEDTITSPVFNEARLQALEARLEAIEKRLDALEVIRQSSPRTPRSTQIAPAHSTLPDGWVAVNDLVKRYPSVSRSTAIRHMRPFLKIGKWRVNGHEVLNALDSEGIAEFVKQFGQ